MKTIALDSAQAFIWNNARILERRRFDYLFKNGSRQAVLDALLAYQNPDGGFGHGLEPDKRTPFNQPIDQEIALRVLDEVGFDSSVAARMCAFLTAIATPEGGIPNILPTVNAAAHAPWWSCEDEHPAAHINPTASIASLMHKYHFQHPWLDAATRFCWQYIEKIQDDQEHSLLCIVSFLEHIPDRSRAEKAFKRIGDMVLKHTSLDPETPGYVKTPLDFAPYRTSLCAPLYAPRLVNDHLDALISHQQPDGAWPVTWPAVTPVSVFENQGLFIIENCKTLKAYGRV